MHRLAGLTRNDDIVLSKENFPGAILFPAYVVFQTNTVASQEDEATKMSRQSHRYLAVTQERFIVLNSSGNGVGSNAIVKSNNHLTEVRFESLSS
jgi:hypothetical protein